MPNNVSQNLNQAYIKLINAEHVQFTIIKQLNYQQVSKLCTLPIKACVFRHTCKRKQMVTFVILLT